MIYQYWNDNITYEYFMTYMATQWAKKLLRNKTCESLSQN